MIKTTIKDIKENKYPYIGISKSDNLIVLFVKKNTGTALSQKEHIGDFSSSWNECNFIPYNEKVILENI